MTGFHHAGGVAQPLGQGVDAIRLGRRHRGGGLQTVNMGGDGRRSGAVKSISVSHHATHGRIPASCKAFGSSVGRKATFGMPGRNVVVECGCEKNFLHSLRWHS